jgi:ABC-2 type transport system ATP-binding protein
VRRRISLTGQYAALDELQTGFENLEMMARLLQLPARRARERTGELLERLDLGEAAGRRVSTYSGGMRRRLDLAASLLGSPEVMFLDEPTTGLDPRSRQAIWELIENLTAAGVTILLTTQYLEEADRLADRIAVLDRRRDVQQAHEPARHARRLSRSLDTDDRHSFRRYRRHSSRAA